MFDVDRLIEAADSVEIAETIGLPIKRAGKNIYCECPSHRKVLGKDDTHISNCVLTPHGYHCFACGAKGTVIQMVMDYCNMSFPQALEYVAKITGGNFRIQKNETDTPIKRHPLNAEDLELIGITSIANPEGDAGKEIIGVSDFRPKDNVFFRRGNEYIIYSSVKRITLNQLFNENEDLYYKLIEENAKAALVKYKKLYSCFSDRGGEMFQSVFEILSTEGELDSSLTAEVKNILLLNIKRVEKILKMVKRK